MPKIFTKIKSTLLHNTNFLDSIFFNQNLENSKKETARFFSNVIGVILAQNHAEEFYAFIKDYPKSALFLLRPIYLLADYYLEKDFPKALETLQKKKKKKSININ